METETSLPGCEMTGMLDLWMSCLLWCKPYKKVVSRESPNGPVVGTLCFHCWEHRFNPWWGHMVRPKKKKLLLIEFRLPWWLSGKESAYQCRRHGFYPWVGMIPWRRKWQPTPVFLLALLETSCDPLAFNIFAMLKTISCIPVTHQN